MRRSVLCALAVISAVVLSPAAAAEDCPDDPHIHAAIEKYVRTVLWRPSHMDMYNIASIHDFVFGLATFGAASYGECPVRIEYYYMSTKKDGEMTTMSMGTNQTHKFRQNAFGEWIFTVGMD